jgi:hypothetical protein
MKVDNLRYAFPRLSNIISSFIVIQAFLVFSIPVSFAGQVTLGWNPNTEPDLAGYKIYYGNFSENYTQSKDVKDKTATSCIIPDLIEGQIYYFAATAYNTSGLESNYSTEVFCTINRFATSVPTTTTTNPSTACQHKFGDLDSNGMVTINEQVAVVRMYLGLGPVNALADIDNDGVVQIWDVMKVDNCYLENEYCPCLDETVAP